MNRLAVTTAGTNAATTSNPVLDRLLYSYFNWRKDTISDLVLFAALNVVLVGLVSSVAHSLQFSEELSLYAIGQILVGQELPDERSISVVEQVRWQAHGCGGDNVTM